MKRRLPSVVSTWLLAALSACSTNNTAPGEGGACAVACEIGRACCGATCVHLENDPFNCGTCGWKCVGNTPYCGDGLCQAAPCDATTAGLCPPNSVCCGVSCCGPGEICCQDQGPISRAPSCFSPTADQPTCSQGCAPLCKSDRNQKKNIAPADTSAILDRVARLSISTWTYTNEPTTVRHLGPMAQDFRASFGLGDDDRSYHSVDAHGVALAAIQALERIAAEQEKRIDKLERDNRELGRRLRTGGRLNNSFCPARLITRFSVTGSPMRPPSRGSHVSVLASVHRQPPLRRVDHPGSSEWRSGRRSSRCSSSSLDVPRGSSAMLRRCLSC
jgi:hypothetical protein